MPPDFVPNTGQLANAWLASVSFSQNPTFDPEQHTAVFSLHVDHEVMVGDEADELSFIQVKLRVDWQEDTEETPFSLELHAVGSFEWPSGISLEARKAWTEYNGVYLVWPYIRSWVATLTGFSALPASFTLPTFAVPRPEPWLNETDEHEEVNEGSAPA